MKILITGITGRIGGNLAAQLVEQGHRVRGLAWPQDPRVEKFGDTEHAKDRARDKRQFQPLTQWSSYNADSDTTRQAVRV